MKIVPQVCACGCVREGKRKAFARACYSTKAVSRLQKTQRDMVRAFRAGMMQGTAPMYRLMERTLLSQMEAVCRRAEFRASIRAGGIPHTKAEEVGALEIAIVGLANEEIWAQALKDALGDSADVQLSADYKPIAQAVAASTYEKICIILGEPQAEDAAVLILRMAEKLCRLVTRINETTRKQLAEMISHGVQRGETVGQIAREIRDSFPEIAKRRAWQIARNEVRMACEEGTKQSVVESNVVELMRVIGCKAVEANSPTFNGQHTCNITGVRPQEMDQVQFHVNHTGTWVVEKFRD